ncbi:MAG: multidrug DMT transporter permease [Bacteroidetes bacterium]|nr:multidrug DMT transporter permease [Bacteroidota bacterium]
MFILTSYSSAVFFCVITMFCWGSWANATKLTKDGWRFELFYWDYVWGILICSLILALTLGSTGSEGRDFLTDLFQADRSNITSALLGGIVFNAANILLGAAISIAGMSVAFPVGIGLALVIGVVINYLDNPVGDSMLLSIGVVSVSAAILLNAFAYRRMSTVGSGVTGMGLLLSVISGSMMGLFYRYVAGSMFADFSVPETGKLSPYTAVVVFAVGIVLSNFIFNSILMARPAVGKPVTYNQYFSGSARNHLIGMMGGVVWCVGMSFNILASGLAGPAISYGLGQGATVIAALWGILIWKEFSGAPKGTNKILAIMILCYLAGLALIILAR